jgi:hypothetical protein
MTFYSSTIRETLGGWHAHYEILLNTRSAGGASLPESTNSGQIDRRVFYRILIYIILSMAGKYLKIINCLKVLICFVMFYTYDVPNRPIPGNIADIG